ncbi:MAG: APC family permease [Chloroflexota bacterium]|nr:APC family permease [Chloroflexota bacterium]
MAATTLPTDPELGLERNAVGLTEVLFQSITHMAPAAAVAFSIIFATTYSGGATPLAVVIALIGCLLVANSIGQLAQHLPSAGGLYTYNARGLGDVVGFLVAWGFILAEPLVAPLLYLIFAYVVAGTLTTHLHTPAELWILFAILAGLIVWALTYFGVRLSTRTGVLLGAFEIVVFLALAVTLIIAAGGRNTLAVFSPTTGTANGLGSVFPGMIFAILAFVGFEAAAPLGEEARNPRRTVKLAVLLSCFLIGLFYVLTYYAATVYFGPARMAADFYGFNNSDPWTGLATEVWGVGWIVVFLAVANSAIANSNAASTAATRVAYAMGRIGLLPAAFAKVHPVHRTPVTAVHVQGAGGIIVAVLLGLVLGGPLPAFSLIGSTVTLIVIGIYILTNISCTVFYLRERRDEFNPLMHLVFPVLGVLAFIPAVIASLGIGFLGIQIQPLAYPVSLAPILILAWMALGVVVLVSLLARGRDRLARTGEIFQEG